MERKGGGDGLVAVNAKMAHVRMCVTVDKHMIKLVENQEGGDGLVAVHAKMIHVMDCVKDL